MIKFTTLALLAGLATVSSVGPSAAQFLAANIPGGPNNPSPSVEHNCPDEMGFMRRVSASEITAIRDRSIWLQPVCEDLTVWGKNNYGTLFLNGNVNVLRQPIARNPKLMSALRAKGYDQHDVVSLRFGGGNSVILYVHQRDMN